MQYFFIEMMKINVEFEVHVIIVCPEKASLSGCGFDVALLVVKRLINTTRFLRWIRYSLR